MQFATNYVASKRFNTAYVIRGDEEPCGTLVVPLNWAILCIGSYSSNLWTSFERDSACDTYSTHGWFMYWVQLGLHAAQNNLINTNKIRERVVLWAINHVMMEVEEICGYQSEKTQMISHKSCSGKFNMSFDIFILHMGTEKWIAVCGAIFAPFRYPVGGYPSNNKRW